MPISTMLSGKLIFIGTSFFVVLGSGHYDLDPVSYTHLTLPTKLEV